ncbi:alpha-2,8-sialyltransferase 8E [Peromyscus eremicus]|uniref:alpha-2,8-sialyltransferase 8E n=1 Tax=Peromyscus eremicus TaxID=42410 RepID=UPI0022A76575|nr:alpha-2,8-sialyltransferase 8E isoform X2 [Peromyscus californicus insignis]XP_059102593.1 alpha-2,8-sialyltransferase 8E [Peromyscus eremicus]
MRYADPSANRDLLGNRTLLFIFICAFALVTLLQQILYSRSYIKRGFQFGWQRGDQQANWTGLFNDSDSSTEQSISDFRSRYFEFYKGPLEFNSTRCLELRQEILEVKVLSMVKQSELFDRWKSLQICKWAMDTSEANLFKSTLSRCCNAPGFLFTTQKNTPIETNLRYEVESSGFYHINQEIFQMFPKEMPYYRSQFKKCAVVGNGGILKNSGCGKEINSADFVFRCNLPPISGQYTTDVGEKTDVVTVNPSIIIDRFHKLEKWRRPFFRVLQMYKNASVLLPAFYNVRNTLVSFRVKYLLDDFGSQQQVYFFHPQYLSSMSRYWLSLGVRAKRISTGLILVTAALELCEEVHLFGFWAFPMNPSGFHITHHYYDNVKPKPGFHAMPSEIFTFLHLHSRGILHVHTGTCNYG